MSAAAAEGGGAGGGRGSRSGGVVGATFLRDPDAIEQVSSSAVGGSALVAGAREDAAEGAAAGPEDALEVAHGGCGLVGF